MEGKRASRGRGDGMKNPKVDESCCPSFGRLLVEPAHRQGSRSWIYDERLIVVLRLIIAFVFIYAAFSKIQSPLKFAEEIRMYGILDVSPILYITAILLPWLELLCGLSIILGVFIRGSALILALMNAMFLFVIIYRTAGVIRAGNTGFFEVFFDCGCGFEPTHAWKKIVEDIGLLAISLILLFSPAYGLMLFRSDRKS